MQAVLALFVVFVTLPQILLGAKIIEIQTKTSADDTSDMDDNGNVGIDICTIVDVPSGGQEIQCCEVHKFILLTHI